VKRMKGAARYSKEFRQRAVERMNACDNIVGLARELGVCRRVLYNWRDGFNETISPTGRSRELILRKQILNLKRLLANKILELDFFKHALQRVGARRRRRHISSDMASSTK
jgi:transposase-like protein